MKTKTMKRILVALSLLLTLSTNAQQTSIDSRVEALLSQMTLEEKLGQLTQFVPDQPAFRTALQKGLVGSILNSGTAAQTNEIQRAARSTAATSQLAASASGTGKTVRKP